MSWHHKKSAGRVSRARLSLLVLPAAGLVVWVVPGVYCTRTGGYWARSGCTPCGAGARVVLTTLGQYIPTPVEWADPKGLGSEPVLSQCHWDLAQGADEAGGQDLPRRLWTRLRKRPGVHTADISEPAVDESGKDPRNSAVLARLVGACAVLMSAPWTPAPARPFSSARRRIQDDQPYRGFPPERVSQVT